MKRSIMTGYVLGLIDAEGSFSVSIKVQKGMRYGVRIDPVFSITQKREGPLLVVKQTIKAGRMIRKHGQRHLYVLVVDNMEELVEKFIPFVDRYVDYLQSKREQYMLFREIVLELHERSHRDVRKLTRLVEKAYRLSDSNSKSCRRRGLEEVFKIIASHAEISSHDPPGER